MDGSASVDVVDGEEVSFVIANTPSNIIQYDAFHLSDDVQAGLDYSVEVTGAAAAETSSIGGGLWS